MNPDTALPIPNPVGNFEFPPTPTPSAPDSALRCIASTALGSSPLLQFSRRIAPGISLKVLEEEDSAPLFATVDANRDYLRRWLPWVDGNKSVSESQTFIQSSRQKAADQLAIHAAIRVDVQIAGVCGFHTIDWHNRSAILGYWLAENAQGRGIMTRCCQALIDFAFAALNLNRVAVACGVGNPRSRAIPERLGFQFEGIAMDAEWLYTQFVDHAIYSLLQRDWQARLLTHRPELVVG